jgi:hypothetical protein
MPRCTVRLDIEAEFTGRIIEEDIGGEMPFVESHFEEIEFQEAWMFGRSWTEAEMRTTFGDMGADALICLFESYAVEGYWESDE